MATIPVTVVTGFLGAGKSTLVERWLRELASDQVAVIVNEHGEVGIDGELLSSRAARLREITGGCICCATQTELAHALAELSEQSPAPTRIIVETSGAASPAGVIRALTRGRARDRLRLDGVVTVVDGTRVDRTLSFVLAVEQLGFADIVIVSHRDQFSGADLEALRDTFLHHAPAARLAWSQRGDVVDDGGQRVSLVTLLDERAEALHLAAGEASTNHQPIDSVALRVDSELDEDRFGEWVEGALGDVQARVLRIKGILAMRGVEHRVILQGVGEAIEVTLGAPWLDEPRQSRLVVLGLGLDGPALEVGFARCGAVTEADGTR